MKKHRKTSIAVIVSLLSTILAVSGCATKGTRLKWEKIADGSGAGEEFWNGKVNLAYAGHAPRLILITDPAVVSTLQGKVLSSHLELIANTDFSSSWVAVIHRGKEITTDYKPIGVNDVKLQDNTATIYTQLHKGTFERSTSLSVISPYYVLKIKKPVEVEEEEIFFVLNADGQVIPQICAMQGEHLPWEKMVFITSGGSRWHYKGLSPQLAIIADRDAVSSVQNQLPPQHLELVANIDFSTHFAVIVYQGRKWTTGYSVEMVDVKQQDNTIVVCAQLHDPHPRQVVGEVVTSPYYIMKVERPEGLKDEFTFVLMDNGKEVARQELLAPSLFESPLPSPTP